MSKLIDSLKYAQALGANGAAHLPPLPPVGRPDSATAHSIEVGLVLNAVLGAAAASDYLARHAVGEKVVRRVLSETGRRRASDAACHL